MSEFGSTSTRLPLVANQLSLLRGFLAVVLGLAYVAGAPARVLVVVATIGWLTDIADGMAARRWPHRMYRRSIIGRALDPLMDDLMLLVGFAVLVSAGVVPMWFFVTLVFCRVVFSLIRVLSAMERSGFPGSIVATKLSGACLAFGQCILLLNVGSGETAIGDTAVACVLTVMTIVLIISSAIFIRRNWAYLKPLIMSDR